MRHAIILLALLSLLPGRVVLADAVDDAIAEAAKLKRAPYDQLKKLDALQEQHPDDPRVLTARAGVLKELGKMREAADAIERAEFEYDLQSGDNEALESCSRELNSLSRDLLKFRRIVQKEIADYRSDGLAAGRKLLKAGRFESVEWVCDELEFVVGKGDGAIDALRQKVAEDPTKIGQAPRPDGSTLRANSLKDTLDEADGMARRRKWAEAQTLAVQALLLDDGSRMAHLILAEALEGQDKPGAAAAAALNAYQAPSYQARELRALEKRLERVLRAVVPDILKFLKTRESAVTAIIKARARAERGDRPDDVEWMIERLLLLAPINPEVAELVGGNSDSRMAERDKFSGVERVDPDADPDSGGGMGFGPAPGRDDLAADVNQLLNEGDRLVDEGEAITEKTRDSDFKGDMHDTLQAALDKYHAAQEKYRAARDKAPGNKEIEELIRTTNQKIFWTKKSMPID